MDRQMDGQHRALQYPKAWMGQGQKLLVVVLFQASRSTRDGGISPSPCSVSVVVLLLLLLSSSWSWSLLFHTFHLDIIIIISHFSSWTTATCEHCCCNLTLKVAQHRAQNKSTLKPIKEFECCQIFCYSQLHVAMFINDFTPTIQHNIYKEMLCCWICQCTID